MPSQSSHRLVTLGRLVLATAHAEPAGISESSAKLLAILAYLASVPGRRASRDQLVDLFFADSQPGNGRNALRQALHKLREALGAELIGSGRNHDIVLGPGLSTDRDDFYAALDQGDLCAALDFYGGRSPPASFPLEAPASSTGPIRSATASTPSSPTRPKRWAATPCGAVKRAPQCSSPPGCWPTTPSMNAPGASASNRNDSAPARYTSRRASMSCGSAAPPKDGSSLPAPGN